MDITGSFWWFPYNMNSEFNLGVLKAYENEQSEKNVRLFFQLKCFLFPTTDFRCRFIIVFNSSQRKVAITHVFQHYTIILNMSMSPMYVL